MSINPITPNPPAGYTPPMKGYSGQGAFRFWCQTVLPLVYDDSLSYYELLNKVVHYLNNTISDVANMEDNVGALHEAYSELQAYVNNNYDQLVAAYNTLENYVDYYFTNLDVQNEINTKLDKMVEDGSLLAVVQPVVIASVSDTVAAWLSEHITPTTPIVDDTLTISGAAADAKVTGDKIGDLKNAINNTNKNLGGIVLGEVANDTVCFTYADVAPGASVWYDLTAYTNFSGMLSVFDENDNRLAVYGKTSSSADENNYNGIIVLPSDYAYVKVQASHGDTPYKLHINWLGTTQKQSYLNGVFVRVDRTQNFEGTLKLRGCDNIDAVTNSDMNLFNGYENILSGFAVQDGYYYDANGDKIFDSSFSTIENIPYDVTKKYEFNRRPAIAAYNINNELVHYVSGSLNFFTYTLPQWGDVAYFHISFTTTTRVKARSAPWSTTWRGKTCVIYGDSIAKGAYTGSLSVQNPFCELASKMAGVTSVTNRAIGGAAFSDGGDPAYTIWHDEMNDGQTTQNEADLIIVSAGTNDWGHNSPLGAFGDSISTTFYGAVLRTLNQLKYRNQKAKIVCCLPLPRGTGTAIQIYTRTNSLGLTMQDYRNAMVTICNALGIEVVTQNELYIHPLLTPSCFYTDNLHPVEEGHIIMGARLSKILTNIPPTTND